MKKIKATIGFIFLCVSLTGCLFLNINAEDKLYDQKPRLKALGDVVDIYLAFSRPSRDEKQEADFRQKLVERLGAEGYHLADSAREAGLILKIKPRFSSKRIGSLAYFLIFKLDFFSTPFSNIPEMKTTITYLADRKTWKKEYLAYSNSCVFENYDGYTDYKYGEDCERDRISKTISAIIQDIRIINNQRR
jgi:hypothetical protein